MPAIYIDGRCHNLYQRLIQRGSQTTKLEDLDVMILPDDSSKEYILKWDLGKYYFYYLYI